MAANPFGDVVYQRDSSGNLIPNPNAATGLNIPNNPTAQALIKRFQALGHKVGAHGGWLHDFYGYNAHDDIYDTSTSPATLVNPSNQTSFTQYLQLNKTTVDQVINSKSVEYSAPVGNNPKWAVNWLEQNGVLGMYYLGDTGMGPTRHWREGQLLNQTIWMYPVMPFGLYATFEDFTEYGVNPTDVTTWLTKLVDFSVTQNTPRMLYFHPPGAINFLPSLNSFVARANSYVNTQNYNFNWQTITSMAQFMDARKQVSWTSTTQSDGSQLYQLSHPQNLNQQTVVLPKFSYAKPQAVSGAMSITQDLNNWLVQAQSGTSISFKVNGANSSTSTVPSDAVAAWSFDNLFSLNVTDISNHGNYLNKLGLVLPNYSGLSGTAANLLGSGWLSTTQPVVNTSGSFSVSSWVNFSNLPNCLYQTVASQDGNTDSGFYLGIYPTCYNKPLQFQFAMLGADNDSSMAYRALSPGMAPSTGTWYHMVGVRDAAAKTMSLYVNCILQQTINNPTNWNATGSFNIGRSKFSGQVRDLVSGSIDSTKVFARALSSSEVAALYQAK